MQPSNQPSKTSDEQLEALLPRTNCPPSCDGYGTYAEGDDDGDPVPAQCQWCYEVVMPLRDAIQSLIESEVQQARIDELQSIGRSVHRAVKDEVVIHEDVINARLAQLRKGDKTDE